ncbi:hypothetical protein C8J56DRAFT_920801 [Mycena floridula]|nr:hypothetical protein C8J56DRAFT_920801 [Mycena floridula]
MRDVTVILEMQLQHEVSEASKTLPTDILREIFLAASGTKDLLDVADISELETRAKIRDTIAQVSQEWRMTSFSYPRLWTTIGIDFDVKFKTAGPMVLLGRQISRSASGPLSSLVVITNNWLEDVLYPIHGSLPLLQNLCLSGCDEESESESMVSNTFQLAPLLRRLEITTKQTTFQRWKIPWSQIRHFTHTDTYRLPPPLASMADLETCELAVSGQYFGPIAPMRLSHLTYLDMFPSAAVDLDDNRLRIIILQPFPIHVLSLTFWSDLGPP